MPSTQRFLAVIVGLSATRTVDLERALIEAGWIVAHIAPEEQALAEPADLHVIDAGYQAIETVPGPVERIVVALAGRDQAPLFTADLLLSDGEAFDQLAKILGLWLPPATEVLDRMETVFGRAGLTPIVEGLRSELRAALTDEARDTHRLAGLSGTLGFERASASWRAVDQGTGDLADAIRDSRTALLAIGRWLARD